MTNRPSKRKQIAAAALALLCLSGCSSGGGTINIDPQELFDTVMQETFSDLKSMAPYILPGIFYLFYRFFKRPPTNNQRTNNDRGYEK